MSSAFSAQEVQAARDYAAANANLRNNGNNNNDNNSTQRATSTTSSSSFDPRSLARALSNAAVDLAGDVALVTEGIDVAAQAEAAAAAEEAEEEEEEESAEEEEEEEQQHEGEGEDEEERRRRHRRRRRRQRRRRLNLSPSTRDKFSFLLGVLVFGVSAFYLGAWPVSFTRCYIFLAVLLLVSRYWVYKFKTNQHLFLLDLCYIVNGVWIIHKCFLPRSLWLRRCLFALSTGPLTASIPAFRNSLVFHSVDKMTSLFIHLWPAALAWQSRWHQGSPLVAPTRAASSAERSLARSLSPWGPFSSSSSSATTTTMMGLDAASDGGGRAAAASTTSSSYSNPSSISCLGGYCLVPSSSRAADAARAVAAASASAPPLPAGWNDATLSQLLVPAYAFWVCWAIPYSLYIFVLARERIRERNLQTLFTYTTRSPRSPMSRAIALGPGWAAPIIYMAMHLLASTVALLALPYLCFRSYAFHSAALVCAVAASAWNGGGYYLEYLLKKATREAKEAAAACAAEEEKEKAASASNKGKEKAG